MDRSTPRILRLFLVTTIAVTFAMLAAADADPAQEAAAQEPSAAMLETGEAIFTDQCQSCHGAEGKGDGPASRFLSPKPRDLSAGEFVYAEDGSVAAIAAVIEGGVADTPMTPFNNILSEEQIAAVASYVVHVLVADGGARR